MPRAITTPPLPSPPPTHVGLARLAQEKTRPGQARGAWGREQTESVARLYSIHRETLCSCLDPHARIDQAVEHVDQEVEHDIHHRHGEDEALQLRKVRRDQSFDRERTDDAPGKYLLDQHVGA